MRTLHWIIVALLVLALLVTPAWYSLKGVGATAIPGEQVKTLRSKNNRSTSGGGTRLGK